MRGYYETRFRAIEKKRKEICRINPDQKDQICLRYDFPSTATYTFTTNNNGNLEHDLREEKENPAIRNLGYSGKYFKEKFNHNYLIMRCRYE